MTDRTFTAVEKLKAVDRELGYRRRVYSRRVSEKKMSQDLADEQIAIFEAIRDDYEKIAEKRLAEAATPGPWSVDYVSYNGPWVREAKYLGYSIAMVTGEASLGRAKPNARYIAHAHPQAILWLITELESRPRWEGGWQPIETAPRGSAHILLFGDGADFSRCAFVGNWDTVENCWRSAFSQRKSHVSPTHWRLLPDSPALAERQP